VKKGSRVTDSATFQALAKRIPAIDAASVAVNLSPLMRRVGHFLTFFRRRDTLTRRQAERLFAHIRAQSDVEEARREALEKAA
jgi:hypothetical protein